MWSSAREIAAGDVVIVWLTRETILPLTVTPGKEFNGRFGCYKHSDLIGVPYGSKVAARNGKGFIHVLRPTPELWTLALPHRTQILYLADIAFVSAWLGIRPGSRVVEAGTGSGSFAHSVARTIGPQGRLFSYEFHQSRVEKAREEFAQHGMASYVQLQHRNVCKDGFDLHDYVDAVFLDLPAPWDAIPHAKESMRKDRTTRICCFSPCMEQVLRAVSALNEHGFTDITMYETLLRPHEVSQAPELIPISVVRDRLHAAEQRKEERRLQQIAASRARRVDEDPDDEVDDTDVEVGDKRKRGDSSSKRAGKRARITPADDSDKSRGFTPASLTLTQPIKEVRGHTSYLTFACLLPTTLPARASIPNPMRDIDTVPEPEQSSPEPEPEPEPEPGALDSEVEEVPPGYHDVLNANEMIDQAHARARARDPSE